MKQFLATKGDVKHLKLLEKKECKRYMLHVKLTVQYTVSFTCNIYFLHSTYSVFIQLVLHVTYISCIQHILFLINDWAQVHNYP